MKTALLLVFVCSFLMLNGQSDTALKSVTYFYANGVISSEGFLRDGKPDGYWKSYYENGNIKSEGNRINFLTEGTWKFYNEEGLLTSEISYEKGKKNGVRKTYSKTEIIEEYFMNDVRDQYIKVYFPDGKLKRYTKLINGLEEGYSLEYNQDSVIIMMAEYRKGFLLSREFINRTDKNGVKQGLWRQFYNNGIIKEEISYLNGKRNGYLKKYDENGTLLSIEKYVNDEPVVFAEELKEYEIRRDYHSNGIVKIEGSYFNNKPDGIRREFDSTGKIIKGYVFNEGVLIGEGLLDAMGKKQGPWKEYYESGEIMAKGNYKNGNRVGQWLFYHKNGKIEQEGSFTSKGIPDGEWKYYYETGQVLKEETFMNGENDGDYTEYNDSGKVIVKGQFSEGFETGLWFYEIGDIREEGTYTDGVQTGKWTQSSQLDGKLIFEGSYSDGKPDGKHTWFFPGGSKRVEGRYSMGIKEGDWKYYYEDGSISIIITYRNGIEIKYNNVIIKPEIDPITNE